MVHDDENESEEKEEKDETKEKTVAKDTKESKAESNVAKKDSSPKKAFSPCAFFATPCLSCLLHSFAGCRAYPRGAGRGSKFPGLCFHLKPRQHVKTSSRHCTVSPANIRNLRAGPATPSKRDVKQKSNKDQASNKDQ